jgi:hypothetical protein
MRGQLLPVTRNNEERLTVIPAKAGTRGEHMDVLGFEERGIHRQYEAWIPAFAGMTVWFFCGAVVLLQKNTGTSAMPPARTTPPQPSPASRGGSNMW